MAYVGQYQATDYNFGFTRSQPQQQGDPAQQPGSPWGGQNILFGQCQPNSPDISRGDAVARPTVGDTTISTHGPGGPDADAKKYNDDFMNYMKGKAGPDGNLSAEQLGNALGGVKLNDQSMKYFDTDGDGKVSAKEGAVAAAFADSSGTQDGKISAQEKTDLQKNLDFSTSVQGEKAQQDQINAWHSKSMLGGYAA